MYRWCAVVLTLAAGCRLRFDALSDGGAIDDSGATIDGAGPAPNRVFTTSATFRGRLVFGALTGVAAADAICTDAAAAAGMTGTFAAWLSDATRNANDLLAGSSGWVRVDGVPFAETVADFTSQSLFSAFAVDEHLQPIPFNTRLWMGGSHAGLTSGTNTCADFTNETAGMSTIRDSHSVGEGGTAYLGCQFPAPLGCVEYGRQAAVPFEGTGRYAFGVIPWMVTSLANADAACAAKATQLGLPGSYVAALATSTQSIEERAGSLTGPWQLPRHIPITSGPLGGDLLVPIGQNMGMLHLTWLGANSLTARQPTASLSCSNWTTNSGTGAVGQLSFDVEASWLNGGSVPCNTGNAGLLCLQHE